MVVETGCAVQGSKACRPVRARLIPDGGTWWPRRQPLPSLTSALLHEAVRTSFLSAWKVLSIPNLKKVH